MKERDNVTELLVAFGHGQAGAADDLIPIVYDALRAIAHNFIAGEQESRTLATTSLVHETYLKLVDQKLQNLESRNHFFAIAAQAMRRILVDAARRRRAAKRGGGVSATPLDSTDVPLVDSHEDILGVDEALKRLEQFDLRQARIVECRYYAGFTIEETASILGVSTATVKREWTIAKAWLRRELTDR
jgi:RNA polymerase sigma factor (TIGR02999 family)